VCGRWRPSTLLGKKFQYVFEFFCMTLSFFLSVFIFEDPSQSPVSTENATPTKSTKNRNSDSSVKFKLNYYLNLNLYRDTEKSEFFDLVDFGDAGFSVEPVLCSCTWLFQVCICTVCTVAPVHLDMFVSDIYVVDNFVCMRVHKVLLHSQYVDGATFPLSYVYSFMYS